MLAALVLSTVLSFMPLPKDAKFVVVQYDTCGSYGTFVKYTLTSTSTKLIIMRYTTMSDLLFAQLFYSQKGTFIKAEVLEADTKVTVYEDFEVFVAKYLDVCAVFKLHQKVLTNNYPDVNL